MRMGARRAAASDARRRRPAAGQRARAGADRRRGVVAHGALERRRLGADGRPAGARRRRPGAHRPGRRRARPRAARVRARPARHHRARRARAGADARPATGSRGNGSVPTGCRPARQGRAAAARRRATSTPTTTTHPAYARILTELAPDEGRILRLLATEGSQPSVDVRATSLIGVGSQLVGAGLNMIGAAGRLPAPRPGPGLPEQPRAARADLVLPRAARRPDRLPGARGPARGDGGDPEAPRAPSTHAAQHPPDAVRQGLLPRSACRWTRPRSRRSPPSASRRRPLDARSGLVDDHERSDILRGAGDGTGVPPCTRSSSITTQGRAQGRGPTRPDVVRAVELRVQIAQVVEHGRGVGLAPCAGAARAPAQPPASGSARTRCRRGARVADPHRGQHHRRSPAPSSGRARGSAPRRPARRPARRSRSGSAG